MLTACKICRSVDCLITVETIIAQNPVGNNMALDGFLGAKKNIRISNHLN